MTSRFIQAFLFLILPLLVASGATCVADTTKSAVVAPLMTHDLIGIEGKEATMLTVEYPPGGSSLPHRHDANVFVYVLQGALNMQVEGQKPVTLKAGDTFYEGPKDVHAVSANASTTEPAKFLVFMVKDKGAPGSKPAGAAASKPGGATPAGAAATKPVESSAAPTGQQRAEEAGKGLVGSPAPQMVLHTIDGEQIDLGSLYGKKAVYLKFWATWCVPCREQMPHFERTFESAGPDLAVIAINAGFNDSLADVQTYRRKLGIRMPIVIDDGKLGAAFNLRVTPQHIIIGRDGRIQYVGHLADDRLDAALVAAREGPAGAQPAGQHNIAADTPKFAVGDRLPDLTSTTLDGAAFRLRQTGAKRPTVLVFLSPWCESYLATSRPGLSTDCREVREQVDALAHGSNARWLGIASGLWASRSELTRYRDQHKVAIGLTLDSSGELFRTFHVMTVPTVLVAAADGRITHRIEGHEAALPKVLEAAVD